MLRIAYSIGLLAAFCVNAANATEITIGTSVVLQGVLREIQVSFEQSSGTKVTVVVNSGPKIKDMMSSGTNFDAVFLAETQMDDLKKSHTVDISTVTPVATVGIGIGALPGSNELRMGTRQDFLNFLAQARNIATSDPSTGTNASKAISELLSRIGISEDLRHKIEFFDGKELPQVLLSGKVEYWMTQTSEIVPDRRVSLVAVLPPDLQTKTVFLGAVGSTSLNANAAKEFIAFLKGAKQALRGNGMDPISTSSQQH